ncbi:MAG TPA: hypothetical protein VI997_00180 [Candidatus Thermoplasmatota archaeon]|nr:hypothetical protein [Candidatus Thermoplasmatota archaeon]
MGYVQLGVALLILGAVLAAFNVLGGAASWLMWVGLVLIAVGIILTVVSYLGGSRATRLP